MSDKKKIAFDKPPVPARPKNLIVLNSKHLPKPPETFSSENVNNFIKDLNLDVRNEDSIISLNKLKQSGGKKYDNINSDGEEDSYGYLEPASLTSITSESCTNKNNINGHASTKKTSLDDNYRLGDIFNKLMIRSNSAPCGAPETEEIKHQVSPNQWQRPLPLPPTESKSEVTLMPWYKKIDRKTGEEMLRNGVDGYFLVRPSSNVDAYLTLTLWYNKRTYNIPIRKRKDGKFALGTPKTNEQCFDSVEYMVKNYQSEKLVLFSNGVQTGRTLLTTYPP